MKSLFTAMKRELRRFAWTVCWALFHKQIARQAHQTLAQWEEETGHFAKTGAPFPDRDQLREIILDQLTRHHSRSLHRLPPQWSRPATAC